MVFGLFQAGHICLHALPELVLRSLHELPGDLLLVSLPVVLGHSKINYDCGGVDDR